MRVMRACAHLPGVRVPADFLGTSRVVVDADPADVARPGARLRLVIEIEDGRGGWRESAFADRETGPELAASLGPEPMWTGVLPGRLHGRPHHEHAGRLVRARLLADRPFPATLRHELVG